VADFPAQSNDPSCTAAACDIKSICQIMLDTGLGDPLHRLAVLRAKQGPQLAKPLRRLMGNHRLMGNYGSVTKDGLRVTDEPDYWGYQTCTEFAFYQTCEIGSKCFFTQGLVLLDDYLADCKDSWNITAEQVAANVAYTNSYYGGLQPSGSRVMYVNGEVDPWSALSIVKSPGVELPAEWVPGASHHFWTHATLSSDQSSVVKARADIRNQVMSWLAQPR
jgi:serine protease 16